MGKKFEVWHELSSARPTCHADLIPLIRQNRDFEPVDRLEYGDYGLEQTLELMSGAIRTGKRIALYADYDVDGTMSCVSWIWFFKAIGFENYIHYIPCRFKEGYGVNLAAVKHLINVEHADLIITMDTGITANEEAAYCQERGVQFICTDHHKIQPAKMPDCIILNPKMHPEPLYQELCGCGITFVLLRRLGEEFSLTKPQWSDILALTGMATICDVVPLNGVNHKIAKLGVEALMASEKPILAKLREACAIQLGGDEKDIGFRLGPRINAVGRLQHADSVVKAFIGDDPDELIHYMGACNDQRKTIQAQIVREADVLAKEHLDDPILFLGGDWHPGVVGIAASKIAEKYWKPTWLYNNQGDTCKGSARSIVGFDVTDAMSAAAEFFGKFGGHKAAGGFSFPRENIAPIRQGLIDFANSYKETSPDTWRSRVEYDCQISAELANLNLAKSMEHLKPFGHGFMEPRFVVEAEVADCRFYNDKQTGEPRHTAVFVKIDNRKEKIMFFHEVHRELRQGATAKFLVVPEKNRFRGVTSLSMMGLDFELTGL